MIRNFILYSVIKSIYKITDQCFMGNYNYDTMFDSYSYIHILHLLKNIDVFSFSIIQAIDDFSSFYLYGGKSFLPLISFITFKTIIRSIRLSRFFIRYFNGIGFVNKSYTAIHILTDTSK